MVGTGLQWAAPGLGGPIGGPRVAGHRPTLTGVPQESSIFTGTDIAYEPNAYKHSLFGNRRSCAVPWCRVVFDSDSRGSSPRALSPRPACRELPGHLRRPQTGWYVSSHLTCSPIRHLELRRTQLQSGSTLEAVLQCLQGHTSAPPYRLRHLRRYRRACTEGFQAQRGRSAGA